MINRVTVHAVLNCYITEVAHGIDMIWRKDETSGGTKRRIWLPVPFELPEKSTGHGAGSQDGSGIGCPYRNITSVKRGQVLRISRKRDKQPGLRQAKSARRSGGMR